MFTLLFLLPMVLTVLSLAMVVPFLVAAHIRHAEAPIEVEATPGWALALNEALDASEELESIDAGWVTTAPGRPRTMRRVPQRRSYVHHVSARPARMAARRKYAKGLSSSGAG